MSVSLNGLSYGSVTASAGSAVSVPLFNETMSASCSASDVSYAGGVSYTAVVDVPLVSADETTGRTSGSGSGVEPHEAAVSAATADIM